MKTVSIPTIALLSASAYHVKQFYLSSSCEAFVPSTGKSRNKIANTSVRTKRGKKSLFHFHNRKSSPLFLKSIDDFGGSPVDSIDELESRISAMKVVELRADLKSHDQSTNGLKKILQQRLLDFYHAKMINSEEENNINDNDKDNEANDNDIKDEEEKEEHERRMILEIEEKKDSDAGTDIGHNTDDESLPSVLLHSKQRWKKKTYLLLEDIRKLVHSNDAVIRQRGPKKGRDAVRRMQRWISSSYSTSSFSINFEDDFDASYDELAEEDEATGIVNLDSDSVMEFREYQRSSLLRVYNIWIHAIAKSGYDDAGYLAEQVLDEMQHNISNGGPSPDEVTIASVMDAHAHSATVSSSNSGAKAAETFLFEWLENHEADNEDMPWSHDGDNALRDSLIVTCDTMLNAWAREGTMESAERAQLIVLRLEEYQRQREKQRKKGRSKNPTRKSSSVNEMNKASASTKRPISYATVMNAWANVGSAKAAEQAEAALESLIQRAKADTKENKNQDDERSILVLVRPDTIVFNSVIQCWATSGDIRAGKKSLRLLEQMKELAAISSSGDEKEKICFDTHPDIISYNTVLSAWSHCGKKNAAPRAEKIVKELVMEQQENQENGPTSVVVANTITFNTVLHAWSKSKLPGATERAEKLFEYMIQSDNSEIKPDVYSFACVMDAWAKSKEPNKASHTRKLLDRLIEMRQEALENKDKLKADALLPTQVPYNTVLNACAFSALETPQEEQREAMKIAVDTYKAMSSRESSSTRNGNQRMISRDTVTYGLMLKSIANLMPKGTVRSRMALQIFQECCDDGLVGFLVWNEVRRAVPSKLLQQAYRFKRQCGSIDTKDLPKEWTANCRERRSNKLRQRKQNDSNRMTKDKYKSGDSSKTQDKETIFIIERSFETGKDM